MNQHQTIEIFSGQWFIYTIPCIAVIIIVIFLAKKLKDQEKRYLRTGLGILILASVILNHTYLLSVDLWRFQTSLPLHLCQLSQIFAGAALIWQRQRMFEILCYWGIPGGLHSLLTPELLYSVEDRWLTFYFYFEHTVIILAPAYLIIISKMNLRNKSWIKVFLFTNLCIPFIGTINWLSGSNYMYLAKKPIADNPFLIGDWPWYILVLEIVLLVHFYFVYIICTKKIGMSRYLSRTKTTWL